MASVLGEDNVGKGLIYTAPRTVAGNNLYDIKKGDKIKGEIIFMQVNNGLVALRMRLTDEKKIALCRDREISSSLFIGCTEEEFKKNFKWAKVKKDAS